MTYETANAQLTGPRNKERRKIGNNTYLERRGDDIAIRLHATDIMTFRPNGDIVLDADGWLTVTTKARMNEHASLFGVGSYRGVWYVSMSLRPGCDLSGFELFHRCTCGKGWDDQLVPDDLSKKLYRWLHPNPQCPKCGLAPTYSSEPRKDIPYADGMVIHLDGSVEGAGEDPKRLFKLKKRIKAYVHGYMEAFVAGEVKAPGAGDCFFCALREAKTGTPMGEYNHDTSHLEAHMSERYYVPSLLARAIERFPVPPVSMWVIGSRWGSEGGTELGGHTMKFGTEQLSKSLKRYLNEQFGMQG